MKIILFLLILTVSSVATGDIVKKWIDEKGKVHYGDEKASKNVKGSETLIIEDTYDQQSYEEGLQRHNETEKLADEFEKERLAEEEKRETEEKTSPKTSAPANSGTAVVPGITRSLKNNPRRPGNNIGERPVNLPAKSR